MAIRPIIRYPGQVLADANYPHGKAQNITVPGDGTGTPWEKDLVNDLFGFQQALLVEAGITPTGTPDDAATSQYLDALIYLIKNTTFDNGMRVEGSPLSLSAPPLMDAVTFPRVQPLIPIPSSLGVPGTDWTWTNSGLWTQAVDSKGLVLPLTNLIDQGTLVSVELRLKGGAGGAHSALPVLPSALVQYVPHGTGVPVATSPVTDPSLSLAQYDAIHTLTITLSSPLLIDEETNIQVRFFGEEGNPTFEPSKLALVGMTAMITPSRIMPGG